MTTASQVPTKFTIPWANGAGTLYVTAIPTASQIGIINGAASLTDGFVPLNDTPVASGGVPPRIQDANGILKEATSWDRWFSMGGPILYDATFQAAIGGYPAGTIITSGATAGLLWRSTADNNTTNPDTGGVGWISASGGRLINVQVITATSVYNSTAGTGYIICEMVGGGGAGGGAAATSSSQIAVGSGGAYGSFARARYTSGFNGVIATIGAGGTPVSGATGGSGGSSSFGTLLTCPGGGGGQTYLTTSTATAAAGQSTPGATPSGSGIIFSTPGAPGPCGLVLAGSIASGQGASGPYGSGGVNGDGGAGAAGYGHGSGGGGAGSLPSSPAYAGGAGSSGILIIYEYSV